MRIRNCQFALLGAVVAFTSSCTYLDDYMFGKDNTPQPAALGEVSSKLTLVEQWSVLAGKSATQSRDIKMGPVINGSQLYTASVDGLVQSVDKNSGKVLWSHRLKSHLLSGPSVANGTIAVATSDSSVIVLDASNGNELWQATLSGDSLAKPVISNHELLVKTIDGNLYSFDLRSGKKRWVVDHGAPSLILKACSAPVVFDRVILVGFSDGKLDAVDRETGRVLWQRNIAYASGGSDVERLVDIDADPLIFGDHVYLASYQGYVGALSMKTGDFTWRKPASIYNNIILSGKSLYYVNSDDEVWSLNRDNGQVNWKQLTLKARGLTEPVLMGNTLLVGDKTGLLHGLDTRNGEIVMRTQVNSPIIEAPVVSGNRVYIMKTNGQLSCYAVKAKSSV